MVGWILLLLAVGVVSMVYMVFNGTPWGKIEFRKEAIKYLEKKYAQEMIVHSDAEYDFKLGIYSVSASPKGVKDIVFAVGQTQEQKDNLWDTYFLDYWAYQAENQLNSILTSSSPNHAASGRVAIDDGPDLYYSINSKIMPLSYNEVKDKLKISGIFIDIGRELDLENMEEEYIYIYDIFQRIKQNGFIFQIIRVNFNKQNKLDLDYTDFMSINKSQDLEHFFNNQ